MKLQPVFLYRLIGLACGIFLLLNTSAQVNNLIFNSSFEAGLSGFELNRMIFISRNNSLESVSGIVEKTADAPHGEYCLKITNPNADIVRLFVNSFPVTASTTYSVSFWVKSDVASLPARIYAVFPGQGSGYTSERNNFTVGNQWQQITWSVNVPANVNRAHLLIYFPTDRSTPGTILLDQIMVKAGTLENYSPRQPYEAGVSINKNAFHLFKPGDVVPASVKVYNSQTSNVNATLSLSLYDQHRKTKLTQFSDINFELNGQSSQSIDLPVTASTLGTFRIEGNLKISGQNFSVNPWYFSVISPEAIPAISPEEFCIGINFSPTHPKMFEPIHEDASYYSYSGLDFENLFGAYSDLGVRYLRDWIHRVKAFDWDVICNKGKGTYNYSMTDKYVNTAEKYNLHVLPVLGAWGVTYPLFLSDKNWLLKESTLVDPLQKKLLDAGVKMAYMPEATLATFVTQAMTRYKGKIKYYEIYNEPNHWFVNPLLYSQHIKAAYAAAKAADPDAVVVNFSLSNIKGDIAFAEAAMNDSILKFGDNVFSFHPYRHPLERPYNTVIDPVPGDDPFRSPDNSASTGIQEMRDLLAKYGRPEMILWNTEAFYLAPEGGAAYVTPSGMVQRAVIDLGEGVNKSMSINYKSLALNFSNLGMEIDNVNMSCWGPAAVALNAAARFTTGALPLKKIVPRNNLVIYTFKNKDKILACTWNLSATPVTVDFPFNASNAVFYDVFGNQIPQSSTQNTSLSVSREPVFIEWTGGDENQFITELESIKFDDIDPVNRITVNIPKNYASIITAVNGEHAKLNAGDELIITIDEGIYEQTAATLLNWQKRAKITVVGAGAGKTILQANISASPNGFRMTQVLDASMAGSEITFKDLSLKNFGTSTSTLGNGGVIHIGVNTGNTKCNFINVIFDSNNSLNLLYGNALGMSWNIDNCLFINNTGSYNTGSPPGGKNSLICITKGGNFELKNSTFISNHNYEINEVATVDRGSLLWVNSNAQATTNVTLLNNAFINTMNTNPLHNVRSPAISFTPTTESSQFNLTMSNNIAIGNKREGYDNDIDLLINNPHKINLLVSSENIMNTAVISGEFSTDGFSINPEYTYMHPEINFIMDPGNNLPALKMDVHGIGYVEYLGANTNHVKNNIQFVNSGIYTYNGKLILEGLNYGMVIEIFTITGSLFSRINITSNRVEKELPLGVYLIKANTEIKKVIVY